MRLSPLSCLSAGLFVAFAFSLQTLTQAQGPGPRQNWLLQESIQADLGLTDKQKSQLNSLQASLGPKRRETFESLQMSGAEFEEFQAAMSEMHRSHQASLYRVLDKKQRERMEQIELQRDGFFAVSRPSIASKLKLKPDQTRKIRTIIDEMRQAQARALPGMLGGLQANPEATPARTTVATKTKKGATRTKRSSRGTNQIAGGDEMSLGDEMGFGDAMLPAFAFGPMNGGGPPGGLPDFLKPENQPEFARMIEAQKKSRDEANTKIGEVLTADQKAAFEKLTGKPFDFSKVQAAAPTEGKTAEEVAKPDDAMKKEATAPARTPAKTSTKKVGGSRAD